MAGITTREVAQAQAELSKMRSALTSWIKFRRINDQILAGTARTNKPIGYAQRLVASARDLDLEQDLAAKLHALLEVVMGNQPLPDPDLNENPDAAVQLAELALMGGSGPAAVGGLLPGAASSPWLWPVLIVSGMVLMVTTAIKSAADVAKDKEEKACIQAGACTDYGFWLKVGGVGALAYFAYTHMGGREALRGVLNRRRS
jgi:hypothetical protein